MGNWYNCSFIDKYIILDNIIVSYPAMRSAITTYGEDGYDPERTGKQVIGMPMALSEAFPSVDSTDVRGRGKVTHYTNEGVENPATNDFRRRALVDRRRHVRKREALACERLDVDKAAEPARGARRRHRILV